MRRCPRHVARFPRDTQRSRGRSPKHFHSTSVPTSLSASSHTPIASALRGWQELRLSGVTTFVCLLGRLAPCALRVRHYVAVDLAGELHCLECLGGRLAVCIDELNFRWDQGH